MDRIKDGTSDNLSQTDTTEMVMLRHEIEQNRTETLFDKNTYELHRFQLPHIVKQRKYIQKHKFKKY